MDIYFCDECGARATDLDIRAGKGMRNGHDTICSACVDQGLAGAWLARVGGSAAAVASAGGRTPLPTASASASLAIADAADPISLARDRARTIPDEDPFIVDEPPPLAPAPSTAPDTDLIPAKPPKRQTASAAQLDGLAAAGGGFGALVGSPKPSAARAAESPADDRPFEVIDPPAHAPAESPFDFVHPKDNDNPGKAETAEVIALDEPEAAKAEESAKPSRSASGRQQSQQKRSASSTSKRIAKQPSTRRSGSSRRKGNKVMLLSLASCGIMLVVFFAFVYPNINKPRQTAEVIRDEPLTVLKETIDAAKKATGEALSSDDLAAVERGIASIRTMQAEFQRFQSKAKNWDDEAHGQQLSAMGFNDVQGRLPALNNRRVILMQRQK